MPDLVVGGPVALTVGPKPGPVAAAVPVTVGTVAVALPGSPGPAPELQVTATHVQWRAAGGTWANLVPLEDITGPSGTGETPELRTTATHIQWRVPSGSWTDLVELATLNGEDGAPGVPAKFFTGPTAPTSPAGEYVWVETDGAGNFIDMHTGVI